MATYRNRIILLVIQYRRRYSQRRLLKDLGWRTGWQATV